MLGCPSAPPARSTALRRLLKFLHSLGAAGFMGGMAALVVFAAAGPGAIPALPIAGMAKIAAWVVGPSMVLTVIAGLLAIAAHPPFQNAGWVWAKAATGILVLEGGLHVLGPIQEEARRAAAAAGAYRAAGLDALLAAERNTLWLLLAVSVANIALAIWRPRFPNLPV